MEIGVDFLLLLRIFHYYVQNVVEICEKCFNSSA